MLRLRGVRRLELWSNVFLGLSLIISIASVLLLAFVAIEALLKTSTVVRTIMYYSLAIAIVISVVSLSVFFLVSFVRRFSPEEVYSIARRVGRHFRAVGDMLCNVTQLMYANPGHDLVQAAFVNVAQNTEHLDFREVVDKKRTLRFLFVSLPLAIGVSSLILLIPALNSAFGRILDFTTTYRPPAPFILTMMLDKTEAERGESVHIQIRAHGVPPASVSVYLKHRHEGIFHEYPVRRDSVDLFRYSISGLYGDVEVFAGSFWLGESVNSDTHKVRVISTPFVASLNGTVTAPAYTGNPPTLISQADADITSISGSKVTISLTSNKDLDSAWIQYLKAGSTGEDTTTIKLKTTHSSATGNFTISGSGTWSLHVRDTEGLVNREPPTYRINALYDEPPRIALIRPRTDSDLDKSGLLPMSISLSDDFGFTRLTLFYKLVKSRYADPDKDFSSLQIPFNQSSRIVEVPYLWNLNKVGITPEDIIEFYVEVADNDRISGPKTARTGMLKVRLPSINEVFAQADATQSKVERELEQIAKQAENLRRESEQLQRELARQQTRPDGKKQEPDWKERRQAEELVKKQEELQSKVQEMAKNLEEMTKKLQNHQAISPETLEKYRELQELMQKVKSPELDKMAEQMRNALENMDQKALQEALKNYTFNEEQFKQSIERTINLLKRIQTEQKTEELARRAEELTDKQEALKRKSESTNPNDKEGLKELSREQQALKKDFDKLASEAQALEKAMKELGTNMPLKSMENASAELKPQETSLAMQEAASQMEKGNPESASHNQQNASENLQRFAQQMKSVQREMRRNMAKEAMRQMQKSANDLIELSKQQEELRDRTQASDQSGSQFPQLAQQQKKIQDALSSVANSMMQLSQKSMAVTPEMASDLGNAMQAMKDAISHLAERQGGQAVQDQSSALSSLNSAIGKMTESLAQMMDGEGAGQGGQGQSPGMGKGQGQSPFERLQQLAGEQQGINDGMQKLGADGKPSNSQQRAEMGRLAAQQGKALRAMEELDREIKESPRRDRPAGDLRAITEDMREVFSDLQSGNITPETSMRQERILSRLLNASRSLNERDFEKQRESRSADDITRDSPPDLINGTLESRIVSQRQAIEKLRQAYTKDYESLIRLYFEILQRERGSN